ncbi:MAG: NAD(P)/FAD-dependent oxidoreductase [Eubacteriales bacterium]
MTKTVAVIGAGAAGLMAAGTAAEAGARVLLFDHNDRLGKKLVITGKGRCNLTNLCEVGDFLKSVPTNPRFLYSALNGLTPQDTMDFFEKHGCALKVERGNRVFPLSDRSFDVVDALRRYVRSGGVEIIYQGVADIKSADGALCAVVTDNGREYACSSAIVCTGGMSYPSTGSTGDGYTLAKRLGHTVTPLRPSLVPLESRDSKCKELMGLSLKNTALELLDKSGKVIYKDFGEMLFTHFGISGPMVLSASSHIREDADGYKVRLDLKPALDEKTLDARILSDFVKYSSRDFCNALDDLLPRKLIPVIVSDSRIARDTRVGEITREQRKTLLSCLKRFKIVISGFRPIDEAIITSGGVSVAEISPKTMESKLLRGLYFAGEVIDVDAYTGGFNLQIAFSTGRLAGISASRI